MGGGGGGGGGASTYPLSLPSLQLLIAGVDRTAEVMSRTLRVRAQLGALVDQASFSLKSPESWRPTLVRYDDGTTGGASTTIVGTKPSVGQPVAISIKTSPTASWQIVYSGQISRVGERKIAHKTVSWQVECVDNTHLLTRLLVVRNYQNMIVSDIVLDILQRYGGGIDPSGVQTTSGRTVQTITFSYKTPLDCIDELAGLVGYQWFLDPNNVLYFYDPDSTLRASSQSITDTSNNFDQLYIEPQLEQVRNRVYVTGGVGLSSTVTETFDCDGIIDTFQLKHRNIISNQIGMTATGQRGTFMTLSGSSYGGAAQTQLTAVQGVGDASLLPSGWLVDTENALVLRAVGTPIPPDSTLATFQYQFVTPVNVVQQNTASMLAVAQLEGSDYVTVVSGDAPIYWWRLNETAGTQAQNRGLRGLQASGMYSGGYALNATGPIVYDSTSRAVDFDGNTGAMNTVSGVRLPANYAVECWYQSDPRQSAFFQNIWAASDAKYLSTQAYFGIQGVTSAYVFVHSPIAAGTASVLATSIKPTWGRFDHIVAQYVTNSGSIYVNNQLAAGPTAMQMISGESALAWMSVAPWFSYRPSVRIAELAVYSGGLSVAQIGEHYLAGKYGGLREYAITVNGNTSYDACMQQANAALDKYSSVITQLQWTSFVPSWQVGDAVTIDVTTSNLGRSFSGTAAIQEIDMEWVGGQRFQYNIRASSVRYNALDHARALANQRDPIVPNSLPVAALTLMTTFTEDTAIVIDGPVTHTIA